MAAKPDRNQAIGSVAVPLRGTRLPFDRHKTGISLPTPSDNRHSQAAISTRPGLWAWGCNN
jgi:hypothetical protein